MDDLDHSIHIAEDDWSSFYQESEECDLLQPSLAYPDDSSEGSDFEEFVDAASVFNADEHRAQRTSAANEDENESQSICDTLSVQANQKEGGCVSDAARSVKQVEVCGNAVRTLEEQADSQRCHKVVDAKDLLEGDQMKSDRISAEEFDGVNWNEKKREICEPIGKFQAKGERDRWFVTVSGNPAWQRGRSTYTKKKKLHSSTNDEDIDLRRVSPAGLTKSDTGKGEDVFEGGDSLESKQHTKTGSSDLDSAFLGVCTNTLSCIGHKESDNPEVDEGFDSLPHSESMSFCSPAPSKDDQSFTTSDQTSDRPVANDESPNTTNALFTLIQLPINQTDTVQDSLCHDSSHSEPCELPDAAAVVPVSPQIDNATSTPPICSVADSPETYAKAMGDPQPVYAISAFWEEMEKLTIKDLLHLRLGRSAAPRHTQESADGKADDSMDAVADNTDSDYFTQPDESKPEFSTSDFEEEYWQFVSASRSTSPDHNHDQETQDHQSAEISQEDDPTDSVEGVSSSEDSDARCLDSQEAQSSFLWPRQMTKSKSMFDVKALAADASSMLFLLDDPDSSLSLNLPSNNDTNFNLQENRLRKASGSSSFLLFTDSLQSCDQTSFTEMLQDFFSKLETNSRSSCVKVYDPGNLSVLDPTFSHFTVHTPLYSLLGAEKTIPIFSSSCSPAELTFPAQHRTFSWSDWEQEDNELSSFRLASTSLLRIVPLGPPAVVEGWSSWRFLPSRRISFCDKGSVWSDGSGVWMFPAETEDHPVRESPTGACPAACQPFGEVDQRQRVLGRVWARQRDDILSAVRQSDMCLVCIAFASWVLKSSDPDAADAWKAALLANVSALSAIQYLRQCMRKRRPRAGDL